MFFRGKVVLIVNVASNCGLARSNYKQLNELYAKLKDKPFSILAFPCNQFAGQEPACDVDLKEFMKKNNVEFDVFAKCNVNGKEALPLYDYLKNKKGGLFGNFIKWNFTKFLVNKNGEPVKRYGPKTEPKVVILFKEYFNYNIDINHTSLFLARSQDIEKDIAPLLD